MILSFSSDGSRSADIHPFYTYRSTNEYTHYDYYFTLGKPVKVNSFDFLLKCRRPTSHIFSAFIIRPAVDVRDREVFDLIKRYWNSPKTLYNKLYEVDHRRRLRKHYSLGYYGDPLTELRRHYDVNHRAIIFGLFCDVLGSDNIERIDMNLDVEPCFKIDVGSYVPKRYLRPGERFKMRTIAKNIGNCPGHARIEAGKLRFEGWINAGETLAKDFEWDFFEKERVRVLGRGSRSVQYPNPTTRREFPAFRWETTETAVSAEPIRFLWVNPTELVLKGDMPGGTSINYSGVIAAKGIRSEGVSIEKLEPTGILVKRPVIRIAGTLSPMQKVRLTYNDLFFCNMSFDKELTVIENDQLKSKSTTTYKYTKWTRPLVQIRSIRQRLGIEPLLRKPLIR